MNLEDVLDSEYGLQQDEWSLSKPRFGKENQLEVVGWSGKAIRIKYYILKCNICSEDKELFGNGYFGSFKGSLVKGALPCGCAPSPKWTKEQYITICSRKAEDIGHTFIEFDHEWKGAKSKIKMLCNRHGEWNSGSINTLVYMRHGCPKCMADANTKPDEVMIQSFFASGSFHPDTKFWRSDKKNNRAQRVYWYAECPECGEIGESTSYGLQQGKRSCACSMHRQKECYINLILEKEDILAIKFGVANNSSQRIKRLSQSSLYNIKQHSVYTFPDVKACKKAERECLKELDCGILSKEEMPDGCTETTWAYNIDKIIEIYERNGGVKI